MCHVPNVWVEGATQELKSSSRNPQTPMVSEEGKAPGYCGELQKRFCEKMWVSVKLLRPPSGLGPECRSKGADLAKATHVSSGIVFLLVCLVLAFTYRKPSSIPAKDAHKV